MPEESPCENDAAENNAAVTNDVSNIAIECPLSTSSNDNPCAESTSNTAKLAEKSVYDPVDSAQTDPPSHEDSSATATENVSVSVLFIECPSPAVVSDDSLDNQSVNKDIVDTASSSNATVESQLHQSPIPKPVLISKCDVVHISPKPKGDDVLDPVDSATIDSRNSSSPLSVPGHVSPGATLPTDVVIIDSSANDPITFISGSQIVSSEASPKSVPNNEDEEPIWSDEDVFNDPDESITANSPTEPSPVVEVDLAHDHFYSCSSSVGGLQIKLKRRTVSILNEFCQSLSSTPKTPSSPSKSQLHADHNVSVTDVSVNPSRSPGEQCNSDFAALSESHLIHAGFVNNNDDAPDISVRLSRSNSYSVLLTEKDSFD